MREGMFRSCVYIYLFFLLLSPPLFAGKFTKGACAAALVVLSMTTGNVVLHSTGYQVDLKVIKSSSDYVISRVENGMPFSKDEIQELDLLGSNLDTAIIKPYPTGKLAWQAYWQGKKHIGHGIYFDLETIRNVLTPAERQSFDA